MSIFLAYRILGVDRKFFLSDVTLISASSVAIDDTMESLRASARDIEFGAIKLLAPVRPAAMPDGFQFVPIAPMDLVGYSRFILTDLHKHFDTSHCLVVQADGFVLHSSLWRDEFLSYDYIGAPWPEAIGVNPGNWTLRLDRNRVGNGGFSLRSKKLMKLTSQVDFGSLEFPDSLQFPEDLVICHFLYKEMCANGIKFAPPTLAATFSMEDPRQLYGQCMDAVFGFHGKHLLPGALESIPSDYFLKFRAPPARRGRVGRNDPCPCGSGGKFKHCHGPRR